VFGVQFDYRDALISGTLVALMASLLVTPRAIQKLRGAGIVGQDRHKEGRPNIPEMGGLAVFLAFNAGAFATLAISDLPLEGVVLILASLVVIAGATLTGVLDDLIVLRQRFKAFIPFAFAIPLALFVTDSNIWFPILGSLNFGLLYPLLLVPLGVACASNGFNMLEGFNGLGTGIGMVLGLALGIIILVKGDVTGLALLAPLVGALAGFWIYNAYPARVFPGDTMLLQVGAVLACAAIVAKVEFWGALLLGVHVIEFALKARGRFKVQSFASHQRDGLQIHEGPIYSVPHAVMRVAGPLGEARVVTYTLMLVGAYASLVVAWALLS
jgi:UDP-N-acetylglucosamine--dolichyl-phosphate N-acetylglucosaminephosphotransferase